MQSIDSGSGLLPSRPTITWTNADLLSFGLYTTSFVEIRNRIQWFSSQNTYENVVCKMSAILFIDHRDK